MLTSFPVTVAAAAVLGILSALGVGGGSLLLLWTTAVAGLPPEEARSISLLFFIPAASVTALRFLKKNPARRSALLPVIAGGCLAAILTAQLTKNLDQTLLRRLFAGLAGFIGFRELFYRPRNAR